MKPPAFQFYPADFLADQNVVLMSMAARGAYITLMCYCWREGTIPASPGLLARLCGVDSSAMDSYWPELSPCFEPAKDQPGRLVHPGLEAERIKQQEHRKERQESGRRGANRRWKKDLLPNGSAMAQPLAQPMAKNGSSSSSSSSTMQNGAADRASPVYAALEKVFPGSATNFSKMRDMFSLAEKLGATEDQILTFPAWLKEHHPRKSFSPFAFLDLFPESVKNGHVSTGPPEQKFNCQKCKDRFVYTLNGQPAKCDCWQEGVTV